MMETQESKTTIGAALARAGLRPEDIKFDKAIALYLNNGGTIERAYERLDRVAEKLPGGRISIVRNGHNEHADRQPNGAAGGQDENGGSARSPYAPAAPTLREKAERWRDTQKGRFVAGPTPIQRVSAAKVAKTIAVTVLDTYRVDGRSIGDWQVGEALMAGRLKTREAYILRTAARWVANADPSAKLREIVKVGDMQRIIQMAAEAQDAA